MPFVIEFDIPTKAFLEFQDNVIWEKLKETPVKELKKYLFKFIKSKGYSVLFRDLSQEDAKLEILGLNQQPDHKISICSTNLSLSELPAVIIHECFHSIFQQLESEKYIEELENKVVSALTLKEANRLLREVFKRGQFAGPIATSVGKLSPARNPKKVSRVRRPRSKKKSPRKVNKDSNKT